MLIVSGKILLFVVKQFDTHGRLKQVSVWGDLSVHIMRRACGYAGADVRRFFV